MKFQDDISNMNTYTHTHKRTDKPKPICPPLFQSWGHKNWVGSWGGQVGGGWMLCLGFYVPPTAKVIRRRDLGLKSHPKDCRVDVNEELKFL